jgi:hypothetical protein
MSGRIQPKRSIGLTTKSDLMVRSGWVGSGSDRRKKPRVFLDPIRIDRSDPTNDQVLCRAYIGSQLTTCLSWHNCGTGRRALVQVAVRA